MPTLDYHLLDVFTDRPFAGNPLAVFPAAGRLPDELMQCIARELNLSETVFVVGCSAANRFAVRIFTPGGEIPFAGHPTVGTALLLDDLGYREDPDALLVLEQPVGPVPVEIDRTGQAPRARFRTARLPEMSDSRLTRDEAAALIGLAPMELAGEPVVASCGTPFQLLEVVDVEALAKAQLDPGRWQRLLAREPAANLYCFTRRGSQTDIRARMFGPGFGIPEDPATGAAASALAGYLAVRQGKLGVRRQWIEQGIEMGRPSLIETEVLIGAGGVQSVHIGGSARRIGEGRLWVDAAL